jgi:hypothetical protein
MVVRDKKKNQKPKNKPTSFALRIVSKIQFIMDIIDQ